MSKYDGLRIGAPDATYVRCECARCGYRFSARKVRRYCSAKCKRIALGSPR